MGGGIRKISENNQKVISGLLSAALPEEGMEEKAVRLMNPLVLAYVGDTVHDIFVRTHLASHTGFNAGGLHRLASMLVCARAQAEAYRRIETTLSEDELAVYKRGRNSGHSMPRKADMADYRSATGLEAVFGYLYLSGQEGRLAELLKAATIFKFEKEANDA